MVSKVEHIGIASAQPETLARWYREILGFEEAARLGANRKTIFLTLPGGGVPVEILPKSQPEAEPSNVVHIAMRVSDFDAALRTVRAGGAEIVSENREGPAGTMLALFRDPEGNLLQIVQRSDIPDWMEG